MTSNLGEEARDPAGEDTPGPAEQTELTLVVLAIAQGILVGAWLGIFPRAALAAGGFPAAPPFFVRWAGVLHLVLAVGYGLEWLRFRRVTLLVVAKSATALFLAAAWLSEGLRWLMVSAVLLEAGMAAAAGLLHGPADRSRRARARLRLVGSPPSARVRPAGQR